jgi:hypothetical protein
MNQRIFFFGDRTHGTVMLVNGQTRAREIVRDVWFDQDINGRWLIGATERSGSEDGRTGAIVVQNRDVGAFLEELGRLIAEPAAFDHEPVFFGMDGTADRATS